MGLERDLKMPKYIVRTKWHTHYPEQYRDTSVKTEYRVNDPADIVYIDSDLVSDFDRGQHDYRCENVLPGETCRIRTHCRTISVSLAEVPNV